MDMETHPITVALRNVDSDTKEVIKSEIEKALTSVKAAQTLLSDVCPGDTDPLRLGHSVMLLTLVSTVLKIGDHLSL